MPMRFVPQSWEIVGNMLLFFFFPLKSTINICVIHCIIPKFENILSMAAELAGIDNSLIAGVTKLYLLFLTSQHSATKCQL